MAQWLRPPSPLLGSSELPGTLLAPGNPRPPPSSGTHTNGHIHSRHIIKNNKNKSFRKKRNQRSQENKTVFVVDRNFSAKVKVSTCSQS